MRKRIFTVNNTVSNYLKMQQCQLCKKWILANLWKDDFGPSHDLKCKMWSVQLIGIVNIQIQKRLQSVINKQINDSLITVVGTHMWKTNTIIEIEKFVSAYNNDVNWTHLLTLLW